MDRERYSEPRDPGLYMVRCLARLVNNPASAGEGLTNAETRFRPYKDQNTVIKQAQQLSGPESAGVDP